MAACDGGPVAGSVDPRLIHESGFGYCVPTDIEGIDCENVSRVFAKESTSACETQSQAEAGVAYEVVEESYAAIAPEGCE